MITLPRDAQMVIDALHKTGSSCYAVGGSVRDLLIDRKTSGWDFTTNATPEQILAVFPDSFYDNQFGTVGIKIKRPGEEEARDIYEVTTYRSEEGYADHRHPDKILWGKTVEEDLSRRDFTINAIAFDGKTIVDPFHGQQDLKNKLIKTVGDAQARFREDALRMMRALRIAAELGFMIDAATLVGIKKNAASITTISAERIHDELFKLLAADFAADAVLLAKSTGLLTYILPELEAAFAVGQKSPKRHHLYDVGTHSVMALKHCPSTDPLVRLATLLHDIGKPKTFRQTKDGVITFYNHEVVGANMTKDIATRLRLSKKESEKLLTLIRWHQFSVDERQTDSALRRFIRRVGKENIADMLALRIGDRLGGGARETSWRLELYKKRLEEVQKQPFAVADLTISGVDVMKEFGIKPGPTVGQVLNQLFSEVEEGKLPNVREVLLVRLKDLKTLTTTN